MENCITNLPVAVDEIEPATSIRALGGDFDLKWNDSVTLSTSAHNALLSAFFAVGGAFDRLVASCPLALKSNNAPTNRETIGTAIIGMINGASRYRHFDSLASDSVTAEVFGFDRLMSCDSVRRNLKAIPEDAGLEWIWNANLDLVMPLLDQDYILDMDPTVKPLYGHQEGAEFGYNPQKPGRPSHCYHAFSIAKLRLVLGVVVHGGNETAGVYSVEMLVRFLNWLNGRHRPKLVRGDVSFGNETVINCCEAHSTPHLFKLKRYPVVKETFRLLLASSSGWTDAGEGWQAFDTRLALGGWGRDRRVIFMRRRMEAMKRRRKDPPRREFFQMGIPGLELVSVYDEMKNQWGWGGFVTRDMKRTSIAAGLSAYVANAWNIFCRLGGDGSHQEAVTTRRTMQRTVAKVSRHGRRRQITIYASKDSAAGRTFGQISCVLARIASASQLRPEQRWQLVIYWAFRKYHLVYRLYPPIMGGQIMLPLA